MRYYIIFLIKSQLIGITAYVCNICVDLLRSREPIVFFVFPDSLTTKKTTLVGGIRGNP